MIEIGAAERQCSVSGKERHATTVATIPMKTMIKKLACQPNSACTIAPIKGAMTGANDMIAPIRDNSRPARSPA